MKTAATAPIPNWLKHLATTPKDHPVRQPGTVSIVHIYHDDTCPHFKGGTCTCNPDIAMKIAGRY